MCSLIRFVVWSMTVRWLRLRRLWMTWRGGRLRWHCGRLLCVWRSLPMCSLVCLLLAYLRLVLVMMWHLLFLVLWCLQFGATRGVGLCCTGVAGSLRRWWWRWGLCLGCWFGRWISGVRWVFRLVTKLLMRLWCGSRRLLFGGVGWGCLRSRLGTGRSGFGCIFWLGAGLSLLGVLWVLAGLLRV